MLFLQYHVTAKVGFQHKYIVGNTHSRLAVSFKISIIIIQNMAEQNYMAVLIKHYVDVNTPSFYYHLL